MSDIRKSSFIIGCWPLTNSNEVVYDRQKQKQVPEKVDLWLWKLTNSNEVVNDERFGDRSGYSPTQGK